MKKPQFFLSILVCIIIIVSIMQVVVSNSIATAGVELSKIEIELARYKSENVVLREKLLMSLSLFHISSRAADLGFVPSRSQVYVTTQLPLAAKP